VFGYNVNNHVVGGMEGPVFAYTVFVQGGRGAGCWGDANVADSYIVGGSIALYVD